MSGDPFIAPRPAARTQKTNLFDYVRLGFKSALTLQRPGSYETLKVGRARIPTLPFFRMRSLYTVRAHEHVRDVLVRRAADFPKSALMGKMARDLLGGGVFIANGEDWRRQRNMMGDAFAAARIQDVFPMMLDAANASVARISAHIDARGSDALATDVETTHFAADVIFRTIFSEPIGARRSEEIFRAFNLFQEVGFALGLLGLARVPTGLMPSAWRGQSAARKIRLKLQAPLRQRLDAIEAGRPTPEADILAALIRARDPETGRPFDEAELLDQVANIFLAGHETSATMLAWALYLLASCPHLQDRAHAEISAVIGANAPTFDDVKRLEFLREVVRETLRLYPPVPFLVRDTAKQEVIGERSMEEGSLVFVPVWLLQRNTNIWSNADAFDPDRFGTADGQEAARCAYMPFSAGPRVCIGAAFAMQETVLYLAALLQAFRVHTSEGHTPEPVARMTLRSSNGVPLVFERR